MRRFRTLLRLSHAERFLFLRAGILLWLVRLGLWLLPFRFLQRAANRLSGARSANPFPTNRLVWAVEAASRYVPRATCLTQAIALQVLLRWQGDISTVRIGIARQDGRFESHAWLESGGKTLIGGRESANHYVELLATEL